MVVTFEIISFLISLFGFIYGTLNLIKKESPRYFHLITYASGCYTLEELWVIVNLLFGYGKLDGLITVRLFGLFGCFCFLLSANANEFDRIVDDNTVSKKHILISFTAPLFLVILYAIYAFLYYDIDTILNAIIGFIVFSPAFIASYYNLKHLIIPVDEMEYLNRTKPINICALIYYLVNIIYIFIYDYVSSNIHSVLDISVSLIMTIIVIISVKEAKKWKTFT